jgi:hypothetical protein
MKLTYTLLLLCISTLSFSQNWQTIKSIDTNYFKANTLIGPNHLLATQIDSVDYTNSDSIFYPFKTLRKLMNPIQINSITCSAIAGDGWLGSKIIIKPNGDNLFFNNNNDTILIKTLANLNDSYTVYTFPQGYTIEATVTSIQEEVILGILDSIKTYQLTSTSPSYVINNQSFKIGKHSGLIKLIPFYNFPHPYLIDNISTPVTSSEYSLVGKENPRIGITKPTFYDIYNLDIGDVLQYRKDAGPIHTFYEKKIVSKLLFSIDSVEYAIKSSHFYHSDGTSAQAPEFTSPISMDTITEKYKISNEYISNKIPEKMYFNHITDPNLIDVDTELRISHSIDCGYKLVSHHSGYHNTLTQNDSLYYDDWHGQNKNDYYISSAFSYYKNCYDPQLGGCDYSTSFISKNTLNYNCGTPFYLTVNEELSQKQLDFYPNPANGQITINTALLNLKIYSNLGQLVLEVNQPNQVINVSELPTGLYFINGTDFENNSYTSKLIIK